MTGDDAGLVYPIAADEVVLGRGVDATVQLHEAAVSRRHCRLVRDDEGLVLLEDLGAPNGTWVNGARLAAGQRVALRSRDRIRLGRDVELTFRYHRADDRDTVDVVDRSDEPS